MRGRRRGRARSAVIVATVCVLATSALVLLGAFLIPRVIPNLTTAVAEADVRQSVSGDGVTATLVVPAGWAYTRPWGNEDELVLRTPDGKFSAQVRVSSLAIADTVARGDHGDSLGETARELLASGLEIARGEAPGTIVVAVGAASSPPSVQVVAQGPTDALHRYRPALAELLESVRVAP